MQPTWRGFVHSTHDALVIIEGCLEGRLHHIPRRPHDRERGSLIASGNIFVYEENASGIKRWTDGMTWSPSRIMGNFLVYRELNPSNYPSGGKKVARKRKRNRSVDVSASEGGHVQLSPPTIAEEDRRLVGSLVDSYGFKAEGLVKRTLTVQYNNIAHHLISYYTVKDVKEGKLKRPEFDTNLAHIRVRPDLLNLPFKQPIHDAEDMDPAVVMATTSAMVQLVPHQIQYGHHFAVQPHMPGFHSIRHHSVHGLHPIQTSYQSNGYGGTHSRQLNMSPVYPTGPSNPPSIDASPISHAPSSSGFTNPVTYDPSGPVDYAIKDHRNDSVWNVDSARSFMTDNLLLDDQAMAKRQKLDMPVTGDADALVSVGGFYDDAQLTAYDASHFDLGGLTVTAADHNTAHDFTSMNSAALSATAIDALGYGRVSLPDNLSLNISPFEGGYDAFAVSNTDWSSALTGGVNYIDPQPQPEHHHHHRINFNHDSINSQDPITSANLQ